MQTFWKLVNSSKFVNKILWGRQSGLALWILVFSILVAATPFAINYFTAQLIENISLAVGQNVFSEAIFYSLVFTLLFSFLLPVFSALKQYFDKLMFMVLEYTYSLLKIQKKADLDIAQWDNPEVNNLISKIEENGTWKASNFTSRQFDLLANVIEVVTAVVILSGFQWWLALFLFLFMIPELLVQMQYGKTIWSIHGSKSEVRREFYEQEKQFNVFSALLELKLFQSAKYFYGLIEKLLEEFLNAQKKADKKNLALKIVAVVVGQISVGLTIVVLVQMLIVGQISVANFVFGFTAIGIFTQSFSGFFNKLAEQYQDSLFISDFIEFFNLKTLVISKKNGIKISKNKAIGIEFEKVSFKYPGKTEQVLDSLSFKIGAGAKAALVGINGVGKTTIVKLLCRFYDPDEGRILINGKDLRDYDLNSWHGAMGVLFQEYNNYNVRVKEAIAVGDVSKKLNMKKVREAARLSGADDFIEKYEGRYDQRLGHQFTKGVAPSVGQRQKLALARVFYRDPKLYILDEPTASIDAEAEAKIFEKLENLDSQKTVLLISHRFSTVRNADKILVMEKGRLKECGNHEKLMEENGLYAKLFKLQAKGYN